MKAPFLTAQRKEKTLATGQTIRNSPYGEEAPTVAALPVRSNSIQQQVSSVRQVNLHNWRTWLSGASR
ncbi:hypothetical protein FLM9_429 [Candidatus Synechococcus spongiarum]|uniref:Uncharacterized protein n=2 Tax=Candidatus Synechococcus spongiarum TaxID=431041 RepID=A0A164Y724_9SYNE|nr:hypothetical protein FLM9_429 [Candidatus Synechococcus spongiarum]